MRVFDHFTSDDYKKARDMIIAIVLSTDMAFHFTSLKNISDRMNSNDFDPTKGDK